MTDIIKTNSTLSTLEWNEEQVRLIKEQLCPGMTDGELALFQAVCSRTGLDPFSREIYAIKRKQRGKDVMTIQVGIDGIRVVAQDSGRYNGQTAPQWHDGEKWQDVWTGPGNPVAARVGVYIKGSEHPSYGVAHWDEYVQMYNGQPMGLWKTMGANQLAKCAEAQGLRKAAPRKLAGVYAPEEMQQADNVPVEAAGLTSEQKEIAVTKAVDAGFSRGAALRRLQTLTQAQYADFIQSCDDRIQEANTIDTEAVEVEA